MSIAYQAVLPVREDTVLFLTGLLDLEQARRGTRTGTRSLSTHDQAILVLRWFLDDTRMSQLARDNHISASTAYAYRDEAIGVLAAPAAPDCTVPCWRPRPPGTARSSSTAP